MSCESLVLAPSSRDPKDTRETCVRLLCGCSSSNKIAGPCARAHHKGVQQNWMTYENFSHVPFVAWLTVMSSCYPVVNRSLYISIEVSSLKVSLTGLRTMLCFQTVNCTLSHRYGLLLVARCSELKQLRRLVPLLFKYNHLLLRQVQ